MSSMGWSGGGGVEGWKGGGVAVGGVILRVRQSPRSWTPQFREGSLSLTEGLN